MIKTNILTSLLSIAIMLLWSCGAVSKDKQKEEPPVAKAPVVVEQTQPDTATVVAADTASIVPAQEAESIKLENQLDAKSYYVIGGSFKKMELASAFEAKLKSKGYEAQVLKPYNGFNRVAVKSYTDQANARLDLAKLRKHFNDISFWLLVP